MEIVEIEIAAVKIGTRHRKDFGDLASLAKSIDEIGLLQPIVINSKDELIAGERRLRAFRMLGRQWITAQVLDVRRLVEAEHDENELRKDFTLSERVAIAETIRGELGNRRGSNQHKQRGSGQLTTSNGKKTREIAAEKAGFKSPMELRRAETVVKHGTPELIEAMDAGKVSVSKAAKIATGQDKRESPPAFRLSDKFQHYALNTAAIWDVLLAEFDYSGKAMMASPEWDLRNMSLAHTRDQLTALKLTITQIEKALNK